MGKAILVVIVVIVIGVVIFGAGLVLGLGGSCTPGSVPTLAATTATGVSHG